MVLKGHTKMTVGFEGVHQDRPRRCRWYLYQNFWVRQRGCSSAENQRNHMPKKNAGADSLVFCLHFLRSTILHGLSG